MSNKVEATFHGGERHPSEHWLEVTGVRVLDPDGWDRSNFEESWAEPITLEEFNQRVALSTAMAPRR